ncbi:MAG: Hint domain-containing protein [Anaerolineae bacterium]|nr:Hint domain-containing protein [Anaerolineae bacterium]MCI0609821.1 Hint domain-containing protein [Anaerolineae bacterium]
MKKLTILTAVLAVFLTACTQAIPQSGVSTPMEITAIVSTVIAETPGPPPTDGPSPTPVPATPIPTLPSSILSPTELKYKVLEQFPDFFFCDPDYYPIAREDEMVLTRQRFPELQANQEEFEAILSHNGLSNLTTFTDDQKLLIYREHKKLNAIYFELVGDRFQFQIQTGTEEAQGFFVTGTIDGNGSIDIKQRDPSFVACPICLAVGTLIDTPQGSVAVENLQIGDLVWTLDASGERIQAVILKTSRVVVAASHQMTHIILNDGRELWTSPGHPTADGQMMGDLKVGDLLDGARIKQVELVLYDQPATYDLLPSGDTGFYWANEILIGSTLAKP